MENTTAIERTYRGLEFDDITECCKGIMARIEGIGLKGSKRQADEALAYACGFCKSLQLVYPNVTFPLMNWIAFDLAFHGMIAVKHVLKEVQ